MTSINYCQYDDHKYAKKQVAPAKDAVSVLGGLSLRSLTSKDAASLRSPFQAYACVLMLSSIAYYALGGDLRQASRSELLGYVSVIAEGLGLAALLHKIENQGRVSGVSGMTMGMYALVYVLREVMLMPPQFSTLWLDGWMIEALQIPAIMMVISVLRSVFMTYKSSYQEELDVMRPMYLVPGCLMAAVLIHPSFEQGALYSFGWTCYLYLDVLALLPQVVMMAKGGGKIEAPIAHFVAATALSRMVDLEYWMFEGDLGPQGYWNGFNYSGCIIVVFHVLSLVLIGDFTYYYLKARVAGSSFQEDVLLDV